ncbi:MAG: hypothetical protein ACK4RN_16485 [Pseudorhodobacter sp.]
MTNIHGLKRYIPAPVKRDVRKRCSFGCVVCGRGIFQYDHFDPEYTGASEHTADGIILLCGFHHDEKKHGLLTNAQIAMHNNDPYCKKHGAAFGNFHLTGNQPIVFVGAGELRHCTIFLEVASENVIWFTKSDDPEEGFQVNIRVRDELGGVIFEVVENEWTLGAERWAVDTSSNAITIRSEPRSYALILRFSPPETVIVERVSIIHRGIFFRVGESGEIIGNHGIRISAGSAMFCHTGIRFSSDGRISFGCGPPRRADGDLTQG